MISIRPEKSTDAAAVRRVYEAAFGRPEEGAAVEKLRARGALVLSLAALRDDTIIGAIAFTDAQLEAGAPREAPEPMPTRKPVTQPLPAPPRREERRGVGTRLIETAITQLARRKSGAIFLVGDPAYYRRFGFVPAQAFGISCALPVPPDVFQVRELRSGALEGVNGVVRFEPEFRELD